MMPVVKEGPWPYSTLHSPPVRTWQLPLPCGASSYSASPAAAPAAAGAAAAAAPPRAAARSRNKNVVNIDDYPGGYVVASQRPQQGVFADREVLPFSSDEEKQKWASGGPGLPAPEGHGPKFQPWRDANRWSGCAAKQFVGRVSGPGAYVELGHNGPGSCVVGDGDRCTRAPQFEADARNARPHPTLVDGHVAHAFGVYPDEVAHNINQFPLLADRAPRPANSTTLLVHDSRLWREWVAMLARRRMIPDELKIRYVPIRKTGSTIFKPRDPRQPLFFAGRGPGQQRVIQRRFNVSEAVPIFPDHVSTGWYTLGGEETCAFQLALNRTYVSRLLSACPDLEPNTREIPHLGGSVPARTAACVVEVLIVSRQDARTRSVKNHDAMVKRAAGRADGAGQLRRRERPRLRRQGAHARVERGGLAAGPRRHRAPRRALANAIFVQPDTLLVELGYYAGAQGKKGPSLHERVGKARPAPSLGRRGVGGLPALRLHGPGSYSRPMTGTSTTSRLMTDRVAPRLLDRPDLTARHLAPPPSGAACPPAPGFASLPP
ncbi:hypothetical protein SO694_00013054 [Aureococcus anophagefferens]|uniref:DUSP domain-containing protein n=1 Tax=Aureococcus anophagefferens TaxID=44056 RepID=A0ABR1G119_AURAN